MNKKIIKKLIKVPKNLALGVKNNFDLKSGKILKPRRIVLMVTDLCNSRCSHCNIWQQKSTPNLLTPQEIEKIFSDTLFKDIESVIGTGGEATTRPDLEEYYLSLHRALPKATLQLSTNALLPEKALNLAKLMVQNNINFEVGVSLDGIGRRHDEIRGRNGNFEKANWLLEKLVELRKKYPNKLAIASSITISDLTVDSILEVRNYSRKLDIDIVEAWYNTSSFYKNQSESDKSKTKEKIKRVVESQPTSPIRSKWLDWLDGKTIKFSCYACNTFCVIKCNGDIVPCLTHWDSVMGNLREQSASEIWFSGQAGRVRQIVKNCPGCLNSWGFNWSLKDSYYKILFFIIKYPHFLINKFIYED